MKFSFKKLLVCTLLLGSQTVMADDAEEGKDLAWTYHCVTCHGAQGKSVDERYPNLAGQDAAYLVSRLQYFRAYTEPFNHMNGQAEPLTDDAMRKLAAYFSTQTK